MRYRVYSGPKGADDIAPMEKDRLPFKEFDSLDAALAWSQHVAEGGRVPLLLEGDDGIRMDKRAIGEAVRLRAKEDVGQAR